MKKCGLILFFSISFFIISINQSDAQCSICSRTAQQQGERPAKALNGGILYLAFVPFAILGTIGYRWWKTNRQA